MIPNLKFQFQKNNQVIINTCSIVECPFTEIISRGFKDQVSWIFKNRGISQKKVFYYDAWRHNRSFDYKYFFTKSELNALRQFLSFKVVINNPKY